MQVSLPATALPSVLATLRPERPVALDANGQPFERDVRGACPFCGQPLVSNLYFVAGKGYLTLWDCLTRLTWVPEGDADTCPCDYFKVV